MLAAGRATVTSGLPQDCRPGYEAERSKWQIQVRSRRRNRRLWAARDEALFRSVSTESSDRWRKAAPDSVRGGGGKSERRLVRFRCSAAVLVAEERATAVFAKSRWKAYLARILPFRTFGLGKKEGVPHERPEGYEPVSLAVAGVMHDDRWHTVLRCSLGEKVWLRREPNNAHDTNAIAVVDRRGQHLGYLGRPVAAELAPYMDAGQNPIGAIVTELASDIAGSAAGVKIGLYLPKDVVTKIRLGAPQLEYFSETGSAGTQYLFLDCDEATFEVVKQQLAEAGYPSVRSGMSHRPAGDGRQYRWYVVLEQSVAEGNIEAFFRSRFDAHPKREQREQVLDEWIENFGVENERLKEENSRLKGEIEALKAQIRSLQKQGSESDGNRDPARRQIRRQWAQEIQSVIEGLLPEVEFLRDSIDVITRELHSYRPVLLTLRRIVTESNEVRAERLEAAREYKELRFSTGQNDDGRIYFKQDGKRKRWVVLVSLKASQKRDIEYLKRI